MGRQIQFRDGRGRQVRFADPCARGNGDEDDLIAAAGNDGMGNRAAGNPLQGRRGSITKCQGDDRVAGNDVGENTVGFVAAVQRQQSRGDQRFGDWTRGQRAPRLFHQHNGIHEPQAQAIQVLRHPQGKGAQLGQPFPHHRIETAGHGGTHARHGAVLVQEARERFAHHPLIFGKLEIHGKKDSRKWKLARRFGSLEQYSASSKVVNIDVQYPRCARHDALPGARHWITPYAHAGFMDRRQPAGFGIIVGTPSGRLTENGRQRTDCRPLS